VAIGVLRDNVTAVNSPIAEMFKPTQPRPASLPDRSPNAVALVVKTVASASAGPAPVFAVAVVIIADPASRSFTVWQGYSP
jgi:hypothetical protein